MRTAENLKKAIKVPGELYPAFSGKNLAGTDVLYDYVINKTQEQINQEFEELINNYSGGTSNLQTDNYDITETENHYLRFANRIFNSNIQFGYVYWTPVKKYNIPYFVNLISDEIEVIEGAPSSMIFLTGVYYSKSAKRFVAQSKRNNTITYYTEWEAFNSNDEKYQFDSSSVYNAIDLETDLLYYIAENTVCKIRWDDDEHITIVVRRSPSTQLLINAIPYEQLGTIGLNAINVIRHRYNLQGRTIDFSSTNDYFILKFEGGSFYNGTVIGSNKVYLDLDGIAPTQDWSVFEGNFANYGEEFPDNPYIGQTFYLNSSLLDYDLGLYYYNGLKWILLSELQLKLVNTLPIKGAYNSLYFNLTDNSAYIWISKWVKFGSSNSDNNRGPSDNRPSNLLEEDEGYMYYDTTLHKPIFWSGEYWIDINGQRVDEVTGTVSSRPIDPDEDYNYFDSIDKKIIYAGKDEFGNVTWSDSENNHYEVLEFNGFKDFDENETYDSTYNNIENDSVQVKCVLYNNVHFFALNANNINYFNWTGEKGMYSSDYYQIQMSEVDDLFGRTSTGIVVRDKINTTPYFLNTSNYKIYRYNIESHQLEETDIILGYSGSIFNIPKGLTQAAVKKLKYYDTTDNVELIYNKDDVGNDLWLDRVGRNFCPIPFSGIINPAPVYGENFPQIGNLNNGGYELNTSLPEFNPQYLYYFKPTDNTHGFFAIRKSLYTENEQEQLSQLNINIYPLWYSNNMNNIYASSYIQHPILNSEDQIASILDYPYFYEVNSNKYYKYINKDLVEISK